MAGQLPGDGYLRLPLRIESGKLLSCDLDESIRRFIQLNLNVPEQGKHRPAWLIADAELGCRVPHYDFQSVSRTLGSDTASFIAAIKRTISAAEPRVRAAKVLVSEVPAGHPARRRPDGTLFQGAMKHVEIACERLDGRRQTLQYDVAFGGSHVVFEEEE